MKTNINLWSHLAQFFLEWKMFQTKVVPENESTHFIFGNYTRKSCRLLDNVEECCRARQAADNMLHERCMLYTQGYKHKS